MLNRHVRHQIIHDLAHFPVVGIIGPRQAGKTTLAKSVLSNADTQLAAAANEVLYLDLELDTDRRKLADAEHYLKQHQEKCVIIDEIQRMPELFALIRALVDIERRPARFILLGSASPEIIKGSSESLAGRIGYTELTPFSLLEVKDVMPMHRHWLVGGFPEAALTSSDKTAFRWLNAFIDTFIHRDLQEIGQQISPQTVSRLLSMIGSMHGQILNQSDLARSLGISQPTVSRYLDLLEGAFVINRLQPYYANTSKRIVKQPKIYIRDSGLLHAVIGIRSYEQLLGHVAGGASWEGYVIEQIRRVAGSLVSLYFYRAHTGAEIDLILVTQTGEKIGIEIKRSPAQSVSRGFYETMADVGTTTNYVITAEGERYLSKHDVIMSSLQSFLECDLVRMCDQS